ncbi:chymotrypsin-1 [Drosophila ficusphila]|uniref:chymotrypsin-1 n=1 Tax=Drosophila ficusphila TaxID=30025 RepID=UPI0007E75DAC|nr:chymotrypsin-1 [Drosophila ficusphila]
MADPRTTFGSPLGLLILALILTSGEASPQGRILGGEDVATGEHPWSASIRLNKAHVGSGAIISASHILTAAHLVSSVGTTPVDADALAVRVGSINQYAGGSIVYVKSVTIFPSYGNFLHDIALLELEQPLTWSDRVAAITLPTVDEEATESEDRDEELPNGTPVYVSGWGELSDGTASYKLQKANFNTLSKALCEYEAGYGYESVVCLSRAESEGICRGDAGAAVVDDDQVLRGITSFNFGPCGSKYPDVATRVSYYLAWITANTQEE